MHHAIKRSLILPQGAWRSDGADLYGGHFLSLVQQLDIQRLVVTFLVSLILVVFTSKVVPWNSQPSDSTVEVLSKLLQEWGEGTGSCDGESS